MLDSQGGRRSEPVLVVSRRQVVTRRHPLDRMPELTPARPDRARDHRQERPGHRLPPVMKGRLRRRMNHRPETLHATQVMDAVHQQDTTRPSGHTPAKRGAAAAPNVPSAPSSKPVTRPIDPRITAARRAVIKSLRTVGDPDHGSASRRPAVCLCIASAGRGRPLLPLGARLAAVVDGACRFRGSGVERGPSALSD